MLSCWNSRNACLLPTWLYTLYNLEIVYFFQKKHYFALVSKQSTLEINIFQQNSLWSSHNSGHSPHTLKLLVQVSRDVVWCLRLFSINEIHHLFSSRLHTRTNSWPLKNMVPPIAFNITWWQYANERHNITLCYTCDVLFNIMCS